MTLTRPLIKRASFTHSAIYAVLLLSWWQGWEDVKYWCGWGHGLGWFAMCALAFSGVRSRLIDMRLATAIAVLGAVGPFIGTLEFVRQDRLRVTGRNGR